MEDGNPKNRSTDTARQKGRSVVSNGRAAFLPESASALRKARRYRDVMASLVSDLGGAEILSEAQVQLIRRATTISLQCEAWDAAAAAGQPVDWDLYGRTTNTLRRTLEATGLHRVTKLLNGREMSLEEISRQINGEHS
jgi:hypothetical protein